MKINPLTGQPAVGVYKTPSPVPLVNKCSPAADQVTLSREALTLSSTISKLKEHMETYTQEEEARLQEIVSQIRNGTYHVPSDKVAAKLVDEYLSVKN